MKAPKHLLSILVFLLLLVPAYPAPPLRPAAPPAGGEVDVSAMADLVVLAGGRMKPLFTHARETLIRSFGTARPLGKDTLEVYASILFDPAAWNDVKCLRPGPELSARLFKEQKVLSPAEVFAARDDMVAIVRKAQDLSSSHSRGMGADAMDFGVYKKLNDQIMALFMGAVRLQDLASDLRILPDPRSHEGEWLNPKEARARLDAGEKTLEAGVEAFEETRKSYAAGDGAAFAGGLAALKKAQRDIAERPTVNNPVLSPALVRLELAYYAVDFREVGLLLFSLAALFFLLRIFRRERIVARASSLLLILGILWNCWIVGGHTLIAGRLPLKNLQEVYLVVLFFVPLIGLFLEGLLKNPIYSGMAAFLAAVGFAGSLFLPPEGYMIEPLVAVLQSPWRQIHILTIMLSYAILLVALCLHVVFLGVVLFSKEARTVTGGKVRYSPLAADLNDKAYYMVAWGFLFLTIGIATGAAWGNSSWGRYWGWDSKEVWATVAWAIYALFLHLRLFYRVPREALAVINIIGYAAILFTYFGVSYLLPGLHAYS